MRPSQLLATVLTLASLSTAWPWPEALRDAKALGDVRDVLFRRQDQSSSADSAKPSSTESPSATDTSQPSTTASGSEPASTNDSASQTTPASSGNTQSATGTARTTARSGITGTTRPTGNSTKTTAFDPRLPAGGISMLTPAPLSGAQYYKVGDWVTFAWNYTSLSVTPSAIDVLASCRANQATYTLALNQSVEKTGRVLWDTGAYQATATVPLLTETYTLIIYDAGAQGGISATPKAGYLGVFDTFTFGMYSPQAYTPWADYQCATCSGALTAMERQTLSFLLGMGAITVLSFTWFAGGFGLF